MDNQLEPNDFVKQMTFVAFDTETTGLLAMSHYIVEIAAVKFRLGWEKTEQFQELVNPGVPMSEEVIAIHGISDRMVAAADSIAEVLPKFIEFCGRDSILIAHNAPFDISFVAQELKRTGLSFGPTRVIDTVDIFRRYYPGLPGYALLALTRRFGVADSQSHRALADAELVYQLFKKVTGRLPSEMDGSNLSDHLSVYDIDSYLNGDINLPEKFAELPDAIEKGHRLLMVYVKPNEEPHTRVVQPESLEQTNGLIYLTAYCEFVNAERTFRLDRIQSFRVIID